MDNQLLNPNHNFYPEDDSFLRFEKAYYQIAKAVYPAWSIEAKMIQQLKKSSQKVIQIAPPGSVKYFV